MNIIVINLLDLLIIAHVVDWFFTTVHPIQNNKLIGALNAICTPLNVFLSQFTELTIRGSQVAPSAVSAIFLSFFRLALSCVAV